MKTIDDITNGLRGQLCWGVTWDSQLNMSMSFGNPRLRVIREPYATKSKSPRLRELARHRIVKVSGRWWLWVFCAHWTLRVSDQLTVTDSSSGRKKRMAMTRLEGQKLVGLRVNAGTGETEFAFDLGAKLTARRYDSDDSDIWTLYCPNGFVLGVKGNGTYTYEPGDTPTDKERPKEITGIRVSPSQYTLLCGAWPAHYGSCYVGPPVFRSLPPSGRLPFQTWLPVVVMFSCLHEWFSDKRLSLYLQRAHAGRTSGRQD